MQWKHRAIELNIISDDSFVKSIFTKVAGNRGGRHQIGFVDARRREETELEVSMPPATPIYSLRPLPPTATGRLTAAGAGRLCCRRGRVVGNKTEKERETNATSCCLVSTAGNAIREEDLDRPPGPNRCLGGFATIMNCNAVVDPRITVVCGFPAAVDHRHLFGGAD
nr:hypothetical protein Iba_chr03bCG6930 [Ipomoea batatas]